MTWYVLKDPRGQAVAWAVNEAWARRAGGMLAGMMKTRLRYRKLSALARPDLNSKLYPIHYSPSFARRRELVMLLENPIQSFYLADTIQQAWGGSAEGARPKYQGGLAYFD